MVTASQEEVEGPLGPAGERWLRKHLCRQRQALASTHLSLLGLCIFHAKCVESRLQLSVWRKPSLGINLYVATLQLCSQLGLVFPGCWIELLHTPASAVAGFFWATAPRSLPAPASSTESGPRALQLWGVRIFKGLGLFVFWLEMTLICLALHSGAWYRQASVPRCVA